MISSSFTCILTADSLVSIKGPCMLCEISQTCHAEYGISSLYDYMTECSFIGKAQFLKRRSPETQSLNKLNKN